MTDTPASAAPPEKLVGALTAGLKVLRYLIASRAPQGVTRIAKDLGLNGSTCFNLLKTLVHEGLVRFDEPTKTYAVALGVVELAKGTLERSSQARMIRPHLEEIAMHHGVTATLWQKSSEERVVLVDLTDAGGPMRVHMSIGQRLPMYIAALGRCMAAHSRLTPSELRTRLANMRWENGPSFETYLREVGEARDRGWATDVSNFARGVTTVSAAILDGAHHPVMAISAVGFSAQLDEARTQALGEDLRDRSREISRALSGEAAA